MAHIVLFHSILGLRPAERMIAAALEADGHRVDLPDLYGGRTVEDYDAGFALKNETGEATIEKRAREALARAPRRAVFSGVSFGAFLIGSVWDELPESAGALLFSGPALWMEPRRKGFPVQAHIARPDPFDPEDVFETWVREAKGVDLDLHRYPGVGHYFLDSSLPDYDADAATLCLSRARAFLVGL